MCSRIGLPRKRAVSGAVSGGFLWVSGGFRGFRQLSLAFLDAPTAKTMVSCGFPKVSAVSGSFPLRFSMHREHKVPELIISQTKRTEKIERVTFPCLNQTGEGSLFRFFWPSAWSSNAWGSLIPLPLWLEPSPLRPGRPRRLDDDDHVMTVTMAMMMVATGRRGRPPPPLKF